MKLRTGVMLAAAVLLVGALPGCEHAEPRGEPEGEGYRPEGAGEGYRHEGDENGNEGEGYRHQGDEHRDEGGDPPETNRDAFERQTRATLDDLDRKIDAMHEQAEHLSGEAREEYEREIGELKDEAHSLRRELDRAEEETGEKWHEAKRSIDERLEKLRRGYEEATSPDRHSENPADER